ncbi:MAG: hypothetical protein LBV43_12635 [Prevotella sp.]|jgi:hypothetical protein|nr:hypothetical protein [Prevotella sp.]
MKKYLYIITLLLGTLLTTSCSEHEGTVYDQGSDVHAMFRASGYKFEVKDTDPGYVTLKLYRDNLNGDIEIGLKLTIPEGLDEDLGFKLKSDKAAFKNGENVTDVLVEYNFEALGITDVYKLTLGLANEDQAPVFSNAAAYPSISISLNRKLTFEVIAEYDFTSGLFGASVAELTQAEEDPTVYQFPDLYAEDYAITFVMNDEGTEIVAFEDQETGYIHPDYGMISISYISSVITEKQITLLVEYYDPDGSWGEFTEVFKLKE